MTDISVAGETFNVLVEGDESKEVLVLAHQLGGSLHVWDAQIPAFLKHFRVVRYDSRGHGASVANEGPYSLARLGQDALAIMDALGIDKAHWVGLSMGAIVGQEVLIRAPQRIGRAVLANTAAQLGTPDIWNARIQAMRATGMEAAAEAVGERWFTKEFREAEPEAVEAVLRHLRSTPLQGYVAVSAALRDADQHEAIRSIKNKVLVIVGRHDPSAPPELGAAVASSLEGAKLVTLEASHISNVEDAENFTKAALDFLTAAADMPVRKPAPRRKAPARRSPARRVVARSVPAKKAPVKKAAAKKAPTKKAPVKKVPVKKAPAKKTASKKTAAPKKVAVKKSAVKKSAPRKTTTKKTVKKAPVKKSAIKFVAQKKAGKAPVKKVAARKVAVKTTAKRVATKKTAAKKTTGRKKT